jgi:site-specific recombinase XerD
MRSDRRFFTEEEMSDLLRRARKQARGGRLIDRIDFALITFSWATGCRASEIASISLSRTEPNWIDLKSGLVTISEAKYDSKGTIPLDAASLRIIRRYVREVRPLIRNADVQDRLFLTKTGSPYNSNKMTKKMRALLARYGLEGKSCHSFRHYFCTDLLRRGVQLHAAKALLRHRDVRSTMRYSHITVQDLRAAINRRAV